MPARPRSEESMVQLATRIPRRVLMELRLWSVKSDVPMMHFVEDAIREKLAQVRKK